MKRTWTFSRKLAAAFLLLALLIAAIAGAAIVTVRSVSAAKDRLFTDDAQNLIGAEELHAFGGNKGNAVRGYLFTRDPSFLQQLAEVRKGFAAKVAELRARAITDESRARLVAIQETEQRHQEVLRPVFAMVADGTPAEKILPPFRQTVIPLREKLDRDIDRFVEHEQRLVAEHRAAADAKVASGITLLVGLALALVVVAIGAALFLGRSLSRQISTAVQQVRTASTQLQAAAAQQASGAREQAAAMNEIGTTISELLASSRQIASSAQRVALIANQTAGSASSGNLTVERSQEAVAAIRRQVDLVVGHMLDLGKKSQQIGGILEIINELSEQTNILAINASIEAAGAGELGRRFAVVAEEIRKLADRVGGSTKDIRSLIEEIRASVNTTVMATEGGSKAVEAGTRQFGELASAFRQIGELVVTTTQAANEIELSTKQQTTAVEQVNVGIGNVAQATREAEASATESQQTASQLATMSGELARLVRAEARA